MIAGLALVLAATLFGCGGGGGGGGEFVNIPTPLNFGAQLGTVKTNLGTAGSYTASITFNFDGGKGVLDMIDGFFTFLNAAQVPAGEWISAVTTDYGVLKTDLDTIGQVTIEVDGVGKVFTCSHSGNTLPICAYFWLNDQPFAQMIIAENPAGGSVGVGTLAFVPSMIGLASTQTNVNALWTSGAALLDTFRGYFVGIPATGLKAERGVARIGRDRTQTLPRLILKETAAWQQNPIAGCTQSEAVFGWQDTADFIAVNYLAGGPCALPSTGLSGKCVQVSTAEPAGVPENCVVNIASEPFVDLASVEATSAQLPADFPPAPGI